MDPLNGMVLIPVRKKLGRNVSPYLQTKGAITFEAMIDCDPWDRKLLKKV